LCNICFLVARDNQMIGMRLPRKYLAAYRDLDRSHFAQVMRSHLIPAVERCGAWDRGTIRGFKQFRAERLLLICKAFEEEAGMKLFRLG
jgi:hypothetical protein